MRRRTRFAAWAFLGALCVTLCGDSEAGLFRPRRAQAPCPGGRCPAAVAPRPVISAPVAPRASPPGDFLGRLNAFRAANGRPPAVWDAGLAAAACTTTGRHSPGSSGGGWSCWSPLASLDGSLGLWVASPAHASILLRGSRVGAGVGPGGATVNFL